MLFRSVVATELEDTVTVRTATLFFAYENVLARTVLMPGTLLVPDYPYPAQRFRFGVYWPIRN